MNYSIHRFTLDIHRLKSQVTIPVSYMDTGIQLIINLTDGGKPYKIEEGCTAVLYGKKGDGTTLVNDCEIIENTRILYTFTDQTTTALGDVACEVRLYGKNGLLLTSPSFVISVGARVMEDDESIESETERTALDRIFESEAARVEKFVIPFIRYSFNSDGTDFSETYVERMSYVGFAMAKEAPIDKVDYQWVFIGDVLKSDLEAKLNKINEAGIIYGTDGSKIQTGLKYSSQMMPWAIARYNEANAEGEATFRVGTPLTDKDATPKSYVKELIKDISFERSTDGSDIFNLTITPKEGDPITKEVDLHLESLVTNVDDYVDENGKWWLRLSFQDGSTVDYELDQIFAGVDELLAEIRERLDTHSLAIGNRVAKINYDGATSQDMDTAVYGVTENNVPVLVSVKKNPEANTIVRRDAAGNVIVPMYSASTPNGAAINKAALMNVQNYAIDQSKKYTDGQITEAKQYSDDQLAPIENRVSALENTLLTLERDTSVAYAKAVPANSYPKAFINSIGGMTYRKVADNLFPCPNDGIRMSTDSGGTILGGSVILPAGTYSYSIDAVYDFEEDQFDYLGLASDPGDGSDPSGHTLSSPFTLTDTTNVMLIGSHYGEIYLGLGANVKLMLNDGETVKPFSAYFPPYLEDTKVTEVISHGANAFNIDAETPIEVTSNMVKMIRAERHGNAMRIINNTAASSSAWRSARIVLSPKNINTLYISATVTASTGGLTKGCINPQLYEESTNTKVKDLYPGVSYPTVETRVGYTFNVPEQYRTDDYSIRILFYCTCGEACVAEAYIEYSDIIISTAEVLYTPYREPIRYPIPEVIQSQISGKGVLDIQKNNYYFDKANFDSGKYGCKTNTIILNGTENWKIEKRNSSAKNFNFYIDVPIGKSLTPVVCNYYESYLASSTGKDNNIWISNTGKLNCTAVGFYSIDEWKAHLAKLYANGNPVKITYVRADPIEEALAASFDKKIDVFAGGYLEFKNDKGNAVPSDVAFITGK